MSVSLSIMLRMLAVFGVFGLTLGSVGAARAASVTGGATFTDPPAYRTIEVSAKSGPSGILRVGLAAGGFWFAEVTDVQVAPDGHTGSVTARITRTSADQSGLPYEELFLRVTDKGPSGDEVLLEVKFLGIWIELPGASIVDRGNFNVTP